MGSKSGEDRAEAFVRRLTDDHGDALFGWARGRFDDRRDAEEVVSEALVRAWRNYAQFDPERGSERAWVFGILKTTAADHYRKNRRHLRSVDPSEAPEASVEVPLDALADSTLVRDGLMSLSGPHRDVLVAAYFGGLSVTEIAERFAIPNGTVKSRLYYGMRALRSALEERDVLG